MIPISPYNNTGLIDKACSVSSARPASPDFSDTLEAGFHVSGDMEAAFGEASRTYHIPSAVLKAVAKAESEFNPRAQSHCGAMGIMQLMPATARSLGVSNPWDMRQNIMGGSKYLRNMLDKYDGNLKLALAAYNAGSKNVDKYGGVPPFEETQNYVQKIFGYLKQPEEAYIPSAEYGSVPVSPAMGPSFGGSPALSDKLSGYLTGTGGPQNFSLTDFFNQIKNFDDFTEDDYLMLLEMMRLKMNFSLTKSSANL